MRGPWRPWQDPQERDAERASDTSDRAPGVIETLQTGYQTLNDRPYLIAVPLALDLALWLSPRLVSPALFTWLARWPAQSAEGADFAQSLVTEGQSAELLSGAAQAWNLYSVSSMIGALGRGQIMSVLHRPTAAVGPWYVTVLVVLAFAVIGLWLKTLFGVPLAQMVRREPFAFAVTWRATNRAMLRILGLYAAVIGFVLLVLIPVALLGAAFVIAGINGLSLVLLLAVAPVAWVIFYSSFAADAIFLEQVGPMRAAYLSYRVIRRNAWPTAAFISVTLLISWSIPLGLSRVAAQAAGVIPVMIAHAYVVAGLATGSLLFYRERRARMGEEAGLRTEN